MNFLPKKSTAGRCLALCLAFWMGACALQGADKTVRFSFRIMSDSLLSDLSYRNYPKGMDQPFEFTPTIKVGSSISIDYDYHGPSTLEFYRGPVTEESKPFFSFDVSGLKSGCVFVFWREAPGVSGVEGEWRCVPLNNFDQRFAKNKISFFNFTNIPLAAKLGNKVYQPLPPFVHALSISEDFELNVMAMWPSEGKAITVCRNTMMLKSGYRYLGMFFPSGRARQGDKPVVSFKLIGEMVDYKEAQKYEPQEADIL